MAVGDVINGISSLSTQNDFQPAAGVEVIITHYSGYNAWLYMSDGTKRALSYMTTTSTPWTGTSPNIKMCINNTNYFSVDSSSGQYTAYSGIQIK